MALHCFRNLFSDIFCVFVRLVRLRCGERRVMREAGGFNHGGAAYMQRLGSLAAWGRGEKRTLRLVVRPRELWHLQAFVKSEDRYSMLKTGLLAAERGGGEVGSRER